MKELIENFFLQFSPHNINKHFKFFLKNVCILSILNKQESIKSS